MKKIISLFLTVLIMSGLFLAACSKGGNESSEPGTSSQPDNEPKTEENINLAEDAVYSYGYGISIDGDDRFNVINKAGRDSFATIKTNLSEGASNTFKLSFNDWYQKSYNLDVENKFASVSFDFGFLSTVKSFSLEMDYQGEFKRIEVYGSDDGYNFSKYLAEVKSYEDGKCVYTFDNPIDLKAIRFDIELHHDEEIKLYNVSVTGDRKYKRTKLSENSEYIWMGVPIIDYTSEKDYPFTDGTMYTGDKNDLDGRKTTVITIDLGEVKNVNEVYFDLFLDEEKGWTLPDRIKVSYSIDKREFTDMGQSFLHSTTNKYGVPTNRYLITRNNTVQARYVMIVLDNSYYFVTDEIFVNGSEYEVAEPEYNHSSYIEDSYTNSASGLSAFLNNTETSELTDNMYSKGVDLSDGANEIKLTLKSENDQLCSAVFVTTKKVDNIELLINNNIDLNKTEEKITDGHYYYMLYFEKTAGENISLKFNAPAGTKCLEVLIYNAQAQLPVVQGGFFQLPTNGGGNTSALSSDYSWYLQLKGMRDLGMTYVVIQYGAHYDAKSTLINGDRIKEAGYIYTNTYGSKDLPLAVLDAAEKLGMDVYLGTMHDSNFTNPKDTDFEVYAKLTADAKLLIEDINELYGNHPAFAGYYLSDETCDQWLHLSRGVEAARFVYKEQSDLIRSIAPDKKIMIAPAIWRAGKAEAIEEKLYELIKAGDGETKPIVDIVAAQDCLGREGTLYVTDKAYSDYLLHLEYWAKGIRRAGADFWHDAEVFEIISTSKRYEDLVKSIVIEAPLSGKIIVFDIPHYFSIYRMGAFNNPYIYYKDMIMRDYAKYYTTVVNSIK